MNEEKPQVDYEWIVNETYYRLWTALHGFEPEDGEDYQPATILEAVEEQLWRVRELEN